MLPEMDAEQVIQTIVGDDAVEVVDLMVRRDGFARPCEIDGMCSKDRLVIAEYILELEIMLFARTIVLGVRARYRRSVAFFDSAIGHNVTAFGSVQRDVERTAVDTFARHDTYLNIFKN